MNIIIFDSGLGGLTVAQAVGSALPEATLHYVADTAAFPYGDWEETALAERVCSVADTYIKRLQPDCFVVACNTASTIALEVLRERFTVPFVGTVPAVKPAAALTRSGMFSVLATPGTVRRDYTQALIDTYAFHCDVELHGCEGLADLAERKLHGETVSPAQIAHEIKPAFVERDGKRTDVVVLGCTHYPLLLNEIEAAAPWPVAVVNPADAIARRVAQVMPEQLRGASERTASVTSQTGLAFSKAIEAFGYSHTECVDVVETTA